MTDHATGRPAGVHSGWYLLAFASELTEEVTPLWMGTRPVVAVTQDGVTRVYDGSCPHRGAHLGVGGTVVRGHIVCPFHGKGILLGERADRRWCVREYPVLRAGEAVFARLSDTPDDDRGFAAAMAATAADRTVVAGFSVQVRADAELIVENAFDVDHFTAVHEVPKVVDFSSRRGEQGELVIEGAFETKPLPWETAGANGRTRTRFCARAFSPTLVATELGPEGRSHVVITGTTPGRESTTARVAYCLAPGPDGAVAPAVQRALIEGGRKAFRQDVVVWENLDPGATDRLDARDEHVVAFRGFCAEFSDPK